MENCPEMSGKQVVDCTAKKYEIGFELIDHPPYSSDLAPSDYYLFSEIKKRLKGKMVSRNDEVICAIDEWFAGQDKDIFLNGLELLNKRYFKCIGLIGDYVGHKSAGKILASVFWDKDGIIQ